jgi:hypothetical protein
MALASPEFLIPQGMLPDGRIEFVEHRSSAESVVERLREYDPALSLRINAVDDCWEIWRMCEDRKARRVGKLDGTHRLPSADHLIAQLAAFDSRLGFDPYEAMVAEEDRIERERRQDFADEQEDRADKLHYALSKDLSAHAPAARPIPLGGR